MVAPPLPFLPPQVHGQKVLVALMAFPGDVHQGQGAMHPFRDLGEPLADTLQPMRYPELFIEEPEDYHPTAVGMNLFTDGFDESDAKTAIRSIEGSTALASVTQLRVLGGAVGRVPADATAFAHRRREVMINVAALYEDPAETSLHTAWVKGLAEAWRKGEDGAYVGLVGAEDDDGPRRAYPEPIRRRLQGVKQQYDPTNLFRFNHNIEPG